MGMSEVWKDIDEFVGLYQVSNMGNVRSLKFRKVRNLKFGKIGNGYFQVTLYKDGNKFNKLVHRLVADAFIPNPEHKHCIDHINTCRIDNRVTNLRWVTNKENSNNELSRKHNSEAHINNQFFSKTVYMLDKETGEILNIFPSTMEAQMITGVNQANICQCCLGKLKSAGDYKWEYLETKKGNPNRVSLQLYI